MAQKSNKLFVLPLVTVDGKPSVPAEIMVLIWEQICHEGKRDDLFYDDTVIDLKGWIDYIYNRGNHVSLVLNDAGHVYHICWINRFHEGHGFLHHCALGQYDRRTWPTLRDYFKQMLDTEGKPLIRTLMGVTPETNEKAVRLLSVIKFVTLGTIPGICYIAKDKKYVGGVISYVVINEV